MLFNAGAACDASGALAGLMRWRNGGVVLVEKDSNLFERVAARLWVVEVGGQQEGDEDDDEDDIVLPSNAGERDWVDECVEKDRNYSGAPRHGEPTASHVVRPDLAGERGQHRGSVEDTVSLGSWSSGDVAL